MGRDRGRGSELPVLVCCSYGRRHPWSFPQSTGCTSWRPRAGHLVNGAWEKSQRPRQKPARVQGCLAPALGTTPPPPTGSREIVTRRTTPTASGAASSCQGSLAHDGGRVSERAGVTVDITDHGLLSPDLRVATCRPPSLKGVCNSTWGKVRRGPHSEEAWSGQTPAHSTGLPLAVH